jgi:hypothetical protein
MLCHGSTALAVEARLLERQLNIVEHESWTPSTLTSLRLHASLPEAWMCPSNGTPGSDTSGSRGLGKCQRVTWCANYYRTTTSTRSKRAARPESNDDVCSHRPPNTTRDLDANHDVKSPLRFRTLENVLKSVEILGLAERVHGGWGLAPYHRWWWTEHVRGGSRQCPLTQGDDRATEEMTSIEENKTWAHVDHPPSHHPIDMKWVYKLKRNEQASSSSTRPRLSACRQGVDPAVGNRKRWGICSGRTHSLCVDDACCGSKVGLENKLEARELARAWSGSRASSELNWAYFLASLVERAEPNWLVRLASYAIHAKLINL